MVPEEWIAVLLMCLNSRTNVSTTLYWLDRVSQDPLRVHWNASLDGPSFRPRQVLSCVWSNFLLYKASPCFLDEASVTSSHVADTSGNEENHAEACWCHRCRSKGVLVFDINTSFQICCLVAFGTGKSSVDATASSQVLPSARLISPWLQN